jgi:predicted dithiol-disulfide oxidoreductase (DUF899 family)
MTAALPPVVDAGTWQRQIDALRAREKAATRELDAIAAQRRRLPMVKMPDYTLEGEQGPVRLADVFGGRSQLIVYNHMWFPGEQWQCPGCEQLSHTFALIDLLPYGRQEEWQDSPEGRPQSPTGSGWPRSQDIAARYGPDA